MASQRITGDGATRGWATKSRSHMVALFQSVLAPPADGDVSLSSSATVNAQIWLNQFPWRPTAAWSVVTAVLAFGFLSRPMTIDWREIALLLLLVDPLWGSIWRLAAGRDEMLPLHERDVRRSVWLPYLRPGSPAARLLGGDDQGVLHLLYRVGMPTVALTLAIAFVLGPVAVWLTGLVIIVSILGWIGRHTVNHLPTVLHSAVTIALPWLLALRQLGLTPQDEAWPQHMLLILLWSLHNWGEGRTLRQTGDRLGVALLALAEVAIIGLLIVAQAPLWLALLSILWLPTWLFIYQRRPMAPLNFWWLLAMLVCGLALGQSV